MSVADELAFFSKRQKEIGQNLQVFQKAEKVNLLFMMDATGSMGSHIEAVKTRMREVVDNMRRSHSDIQMRVGVLAYRDHSDAKRFETQTFTDNIGQFETFLAGVKANGGGDAPEDIHGALKLAGEQPWTTGDASTRVLIHIADAPCHGSKYHDCSGDSHSGGDPHGLQAVNLLRRLQSLSVKYTFGRINTSTDKMIRLFNQEVGGDEEYIGTCEATDVQKMTKIVTSALRSSIAKTAAELQTQVLLASGLAIRNYKIEKGMPSWDSVPTLMATVYTNVPVTLDQICMRLPTNDTEADTMCLKIAANPFAEGGLTLTRHCQVITDKATLHILKDFRLKGPDVHTLDRYMKQGEVAEVASQMAEGYNKGRNPGCKPIRFLQAQTVEAETMDGKLRYYNMEKLMPESGTKFTVFFNNVGYMDDEEMDESLARFMEWTHDITHGFLMVADLKGVKTEEEFVLSNPVIHCTDLTRFGTSNMGPEGIARCQKSLKAFFQERGLSSS